MRFSPLFCLKFLVVMTTFFLSSCFSMDERDNPKIIAVIEQAIKLNAKLEYGISYKEYKSSFTELVPLIEIANNEEMSDELGNMIEKIKRYSINLQAMLDLKYNIDYCTIKEAQDFDDYSKKKYSVELCKIGVMVAEDERFSYFEKESKALGDLYKLRRDILSRILKEDFHISPENDDFSPIFFDKIIPIEMSLLTSSIEKAQKYFYQISTESEKSIDSSKVDD